MTDFPRTITVQPAGGLLSAAAIAAAYQQTVALSGTSTSYGVHCQLAGGELLVQSRGVDAGPFTVVHYGSDFAPLGTISLPIPANAPPDPRLFGLLDRAGGPRWTIGRYYAVTPDNYASQVLGDGPAEVLAGVVHQRAQGALCELVGHDWAIIPAGGPGSSYRCHGPGLIAVDSLSATTYLDYPSTHKHPDSQQAPGATVGGAAVVGETVVFAVQSAAGVKWYGEWNQGPNGEVDIWDGSKGYHASQYTQELWLYRLADLQAVAAGWMQPWEPREYERLDLRQWLPAESSPKGRIACSYRDGRLLVIQQHYTLTSNDYRPRAIVFEGL